MEDILSRLNNLSDLDQKIIQEAKRQFDENGFYKTSVDEIADRLSIGKGTIYRHFGNKVELFLSVTIYDLENTKKRISEIDKGNGFEISIDRFFDLLIEMFIEKNRKKSSPMSLEGIMVIHKEDAFKKFLPVFLPYIFDYRNFMITKVKELLEIGVEEGIISDSNLDEKSEIIFVLVLNYFKYKFFAYRLEEVFTEVKDSKHIDKEEVKKIVKDFIFNGLKER